MTFHEGPVEKQVAHKHLQENVFIRNFRRAIPSTIPREVVENIVLARLGESDKEIFQDYYQPQKVGKGEIRSKAGDQQAYVLFNVPHALPSEIFDNPANPTQFSPRERKTLLEYYHPNPDNGHYILKRAITEMEETVIESILGRKDIHLTDSERIMLANLFESVEDFPKEEVFYGGLEINATHSFFFEHPNEHVPGMMVLEAARQFAIACWHVFGRIPIKGVQFIMTTFNSTFMDYVDLNYPAGIKGEVLQLEKTKSGEWSSAVLKVTIFQQGDVCAEVEAHARVISKKLFQRMREGREEVNPLHRFFPIENIHYQISLWNPEKGSYLNATLWDLSLEGFRLEINDKIEEAVSHPEFDFFVCFEEIGFIKGKCQLVWHQRYRDTNWIGFHISEIAPADKKNLKTAIRQFCHLRLERERV